MLLEQSAPRNHIVNMSSFGADAPQFVEHFFLYLEQYGADHLFIGALWSRFVEHRLLAVWSIFGEIWSRFVKFR